MCGVRLDLWGEEWDLWGEEWDVWGEEWDVWGTDAPLGGGGGLPHRSQWGAVLPHCDPIAAAGLQFRSAPQGAAMGRPQWGQVGKPDRRRREN